MSCCIPDIFFFSDEAITDIHVSAEMLSRYGQVPLVEILYFNDDGGYYDQSYYSSSVQLLGSPVNMIRIDHGGSNLAGVVRVS